MVDRVTLTETYKTGKGAGIIVAESGKVRGPYKVTVLVGDREPKTRKVKKLGEARAALRGKLGPLRKAKNPNEVIRLVLGEGEEARVTETVNPRQTHGGSGGYAYAVESAKDGRLYRGMSREEATDFAQGEAATFGQTIPVYRLGPLGMERDTQPVAFVDQRGRWTPFSGQQSNPPALANPPVDPKSTRDYPGRPAARIQEDDAREAGYAMGAQHQRRGKRFPGVAGLQKMARDESKRLASKVSRIPLGNRDLAWLSSYWTIGYKQGFEEAGKRNPVGRKSNPANMDDADRLYENFHGRPPTQTTRVVTRTKARTDLAELGPLTELKVHLLTGKRIKLPYEVDCADQVMLCSSPDGRQLYFVGGDQTIDLRRLGMAGREWVKDSMVLGVLEMVTYRTEKGFDKFKLTDYYHELGEESGMQPLLVYDNINGLLSVAGGQYEVRPEGIVN